MRRFGLQMWAALTVFTTALTFVATTPLPTFSRVRPDDTRFSKQVDDGIAAYRNGSNVLAEPAELLWRDFEIVFQNMRYNYSTITPGTEEVRLDGSTPNEHNVCDNFTRVFIFVPTRPDSFQQRANIRSSWANRNVTRAQNMIVRFVVGRTRDCLVSEMLFEELKTHNDLIINDIPDTYDNLFLKVYAAFQWQRTFCKDVEFVLKIDDDTLLNSQRLMCWIHEEFRPTVREYPLSVFGTGIKKNVPIRESPHRWYVPREAFPNPVFPPYVTGAAYLLSNAAVEGILRQAPHFNAFTIEDALFTGILGGAAGVHKFDAVNFFRGGTNATEIYEYEKCDYRQEPFVLSLFGYPDELFENRYEKLITTKCLPAKFFKATELQPFTEM